MLACVDRRERLDTAITAMAGNSAFTPVVTRLGCLRGISTLTAFGLAVEIGDWQRLNGRSIGAYLGSVPTENSSGGDPFPGRGHQDRQQPCPSPAGRSGMASPPPVPARARAAEAVGDGFPCSPGTGPGSQPAVECSLGWFR